MTVFYDRYYYKMRQVFHYKMRQNFITKCVRFFITKWNNFITKCGSYYIMRRFYYKMGQLLQSITLITNRDSTVRNISDLGNMTCVTSKLAMKQFWSKMQNKYKSRDQIKCYNSIIVGFIC